MGQICYPSAGAISDMQHKNCYIYSCFHSSIYRLVSHRRAVDTDPLSTVNCNN